MKRLINWPQMALALAGFGVAFYSLVVHNRVKGGGESGCGITATVSCDDVLASKYATFLGVPWGLWGMLFFVVVAMMAINTIKPNETRAAAQWRTAKMELALAVVGISTSIILTLVSKFLIGKYCPVCLMTHTVTTLFLLLALFDFFRARKAFREYSQAAP